MDLIRKVLLVLTVMISSFYILDLLAPLEIGKANEPRITEEYGTVRRVQQKNPEWFYYFVKTRVSDKDEWLLKWSWNSKTKEWWRWLTIKWADKPEYKSLDNDKLPE